MRHRMMELLDGIMLNLRARLAAVGVVGGAGKRAGWLLGLAMALLALGTPVEFASGVRAQADVSNSISLQVYTCPPGVTAESLVSDDCAPITEGFDAEITSLGGVMPPLTLAEATLDGGTFVWSNEIIDTYGAFGPLAIKETALPAGYTDYIVAGAELDEFDHWAFEVSPETPNPSLAIYNFAPAETDEAPAPTELPAAPTVPAAPTAGHPVHVHAGTCADLDPEPRFELTGVAAAEGEPEGSEDAISAEASYSALDVPLDDLLSAAHAITVHESEEALQEGEAESVIACGEVGGVRRADGTISIGLREQNDSSFVGIAYLAPDPEDAGRTQVSVFIAQHLVEDGRATG